MIIKSIAILPIQLRDISIPLLTMPVIRINYGISYCTSASLSDFSYGELIIYQNNIPKFYFSAFENNDALISEAEKQNMTISEYLVYLLTQNGINNVHSKEFGITLLRFHNKACMKTYKLLSIKVDTA